MASTQASVSSKAYLLGLPAELRNQIYEHALTLDDSLKDDDGGSNFHVSKRASKRKGPSSQALVAVNRQIHAETEGLFYRLQHPHFSNPRELKSFLRTMPPRRLQGLTELAVDVKGAESLSAALRSLAGKEVPSLQTVTIWITSWDRPRFSPRPSNIPGPREAKFLLSVIRKLPLSVTTIRLMIREELHADAWGYAVVMRLEGFSNKVLSELRRKRIAKEKAGK